MSKIKGCQLTREATDIPFDFDHGTCGSYVIDEVVQDVVLLCFPRNQPNDCWRYVDIKLVEKYLLISVLTEAHIERFQQSHCMNTNMLE